MKLEASDSPEELRRIESYRKLATAAAFASLFAYAIVLVITQSLNNEVQARYGASFSKLGWLMPSMMMGFFAAVMTSGHYSDRIGKLPLLLLGCLCMGVGALIFGLAPTFAIAAAAILIMGIGGGFCEGTACALVTDLYSGPSRASMMNLAQAAFGVGAVLVPVGTGALLKFDIDWRLAYYATSAICILTGFATLAALLSRCEKPLGTHGESGWRDVLFDPIVVMLSIGILLYVGAEQSQSNWMAIYFKHALKASASVAASSVAPFWLGILAGRLAAAVVLRYMSETALLCWALALGVVAQVTLLLIGSPEAGLMASFAVGLFSGPVWPTIVSRAGAAYPTRTGLVTGIVVAVGALGAAIFPPIVGAASDHFGIRAALWVCVGLLAGNFAVFLRLRAYRVSSVLRES